ncbi:uncharacterized protein MCYG_02184 [Microsporum canis CBS 113480]|uniref:Uncharacterized protein n=1 Tax=Arthroderma otae (strain ATCC MYA-4605 / CBS 113480) TaxID=554155 RepID=C5FJ35_ARTOC|nr:uncharacterized protein MCYG_02184 [Microsporum canis CBS 113480]EEQ29365.1 predicted protein [Microsporum canis CBS 113480]
MHVPRSMHESLFIDQTHEVLRLNGMKGNNPLVEVRTHDGSIRHGDCRWVDFAHMSRAWEVYQRDDGETFNPSIKSMIFLCHKAGKQTHKRWRGRMVVANTDAVDRIESYQGVIYGTATGGRHMVLATAWVRRKREQVIFPSVKMVLVCCL